MNRKQFVMVLLALCVIGGAGLALFNKKQKTWNVREAKVGEYVFPDFKPNDVAGIHVVAADDFRVVRSNGVWVVPARYNYPANFEQISELLLEIKNLKVMQSEIAGASMRPRVDLAAPGSAAGAGQLVEFEDDKGKVLYSLLLGRRHDRKQNENEPLGIHGWFDGRYVLIPSEPENVLLVPTELPGAAPSPAGWLNPAFFKIENPKFIGVVSPDTNKNWELVRETPDSKWTMNGAAPDETLDREKVAQATEIWQFPRFVDVGSNLPPAMTGLDKPTVVTVITFDEVAYTVKVGKRISDENYFMTLSVAGNPPAERMANPGESPDEKKKLDDEYQAKKKTLEQKLANERKLAPLIFVTDNWMNCIMRDRSLLAHAPQKSTQEASAK